MKNKLLKALWTFIIISLILTINFIIFKTELNAYFMFGSWMISVVLKTIHQEYGKRRE